MSPLVRPEYLAGSFADLPQTFRELLQGQGDSRLLNGPLTSIARRYDKVLFLFADGLGWRFLEARMGNNRFLKQCQEEGVVAKMTSQFPSTTAAHVTTIHSGMAMNQTGVYEWNLYLPQLDEVISPLLWNVSGDGVRETLRGRVHPAEVFPKNTWYETSLGEASVASHLFINGLLVDTTYSRWMNRGAVVHPVHETSGFLPEVLKTLGGTIEQTEGPAYFSYYYADIDVANHLHGPQSGEVRAVIDTWFEALGDWLDRWRRKLPNTLLIMSADHGHVETDPAKTIYLNRQERFKDLLGWLQRDRRGHPIVPAGSSRDFFLHVQPERLTEAAPWLAERLEGIAGVRLTAQLEAEGYFGSEPSAERFRERVGNLVILPYRNESVWWYERDRHEHTFRGHHGGLTPQELEIPLIALPLG